MRDDFALDVKRMIALRVAYRCCNPTCGATTTGPQVDPGKATNIGVAAHITAAAPGGPRYEGSASVEQRTSSENGIWLCQNCAKLIDNDEVRFSETLLRHWKQIAEHRASEQLGRRSPFDRGDAPVLEAHMPGSGQRVKPVSTEPLSMDTIQQLCALLPDDAQAVEQRKLLGCGRGAMGQMYGIIGTARNAGWDWTVGLFTASEFGWELVASILLAGQKGWVPEAMYISGTPGALALTHVHGWGSGVFRRSISWFRIARGEPTPLLSYPHDFYIVGWGMPFARRLTSTPLTVPSRLLHGSSLDLRFEITYTMGTPDSNDETPDILFSTSETLALTWNEAVQTFAPRSPSDDFARIEEIWSEGTETFIERNIERLRSLSAKGSARQQRFIKSHLL